jgi:hypothetical protein
MKVEVVKAYGPFSAGAIIPEMPGNVARPLIERGYIREVAEPVSPRALRAPFDRAMRPAVQPGGGKPVISR